MGFPALVLAAMVAQAGQAPARHPQPLPPPLAGPVRIELRVTTRAGSALVSIPQGFAAAAVRSVSGPPDTSAFIAGTQLVLAGGPGGDERVAIFRVVLETADAQPPVALSFAMAGFGPPATLTVFNVNDEARPAELARTDSRQLTGVVLPVAQLRAGSAALTLPTRERLVMAHYYPWWDRPSWADTRLLDTPRQLYSTDDPADVARVLRDMAGAGIDVAIVSWQGSESRGGFYARGLRHVLDAAQQAGIRVSVMLETAAANRIEEGFPPDPEVLTGWMTELIDGYANHPSFLKVDGRPVLFAYIWGFAGDDLWRTILARVRASGRNPLVMADSLDAPPLGVADGSFTYSGTLFEPLTRMQQSVRAARAWHLLGAEFGPPRIAAASVIPGYDETRLGRPTRRSVDREAGEFYDRQWQAALATNPDWVVITSWNEWAENTQIEAGQRFGEYYVWRTRFWSAAFTRAPRE
jgi:hypothetical protein